MVTIAVFGFVALCLWAVATVLASVTSTVTTQMLEQGVQFACSCLNQIRSANSNVVDRRS